MGDPVNFPVSIPPGYGLKVLTAAEKASRMAEDDLLGLLDTLLIWEPPRRQCLYAIGVDVSGGMGNDFSVIDVCRVGDLRRGAEQVAQFVTSTLDPIDLAYLINPIGQMYTGRDGLPAQVAIECNFGLGLGTQSELLRHIGYENLFIWQVEDAVDVQHRYKTSYGWYTNGRTRPLILQRYFHAIKTIDKHTKVADYRINSPITQQELNDFVTAGVIWEGEAAPGGHDDCIIAGAIAHHVSHTLVQDTYESMNEARRRISTEKANADVLEERLARGINHQTIDVTVDELDGHTDDGIVDMIGQPEHYL